MYFSVDEILAKNKLDVIDFKIGCISEENFLKINDLIIPEILENMKKNKSAVIDGNFYHKRAIEHFLLKFNKKDVLVFTLKANKDTCIKRDSQREKPYGVVAAEAVYDLVSSFDYGTIILNEDDNIDEKIKIMMNEIK